MDRNFARITCLAALVLLAACGGQGSGAKPADAAAPAAASPQPETIATTRQVMLAITVPTSNALFQVGDGPKDDAGWELLAANAAALAESGQLLLAGTRNVGQPEWTQFAQALVAAARKSGAAAQEKNVEKVLEAGDELYGTCEGCHAKYLPQSAAAPAQ